MPGANKLRTDLLPSTLGNAAKIPFYRDLWQGHSVDNIRCIEDLSQLPLVSKQLYRDSFMFDARSMAESEFITHTTGSTGKITWRHRSPAEAAVINHLFGLATQQPEESQLALTIEYGRHGMAMPMPGSSRSFPIAISDDTELDQAIAALESEFHFSNAVLRPSVLAGGVQHLALLAQAWLERGLKKKPSSIRAIHVLGYTDPGLYEFLMQAFDGPTFYENFSMAEVFGSAGRFWPSRNFVLDPHVIGEVVGDDGTCMPVGSIGELVLTELFPFVQMQPLIRYRTDDIVVLLQNDDEFGFQFDWLGRRQDCVAPVEDGGSSWTFGYAPVADWLSRQPLVARESRSSHLSIASTDFGPPCFAMFWHAADSCIDFTVGVRFNPWWARQTTNDFVRKLWAALQQLVLNPRAQPSIRLSLQHIAVSTPHFSSNGQSELVFAPALLGGPPPDITFSN